MHLRTALACTPQQGTTTGATRTGGTTGGALERTVALLVPCSTTSRTTLSDQQHCTGHINRAITGQSITDSITGATPLPHNHQQADDKLFFSNKAANRSRQTQEQVLKRLLELGSSPLERVQSQPWRRKTRASMQRFAKGEEGDSAGRREAPGDLAVTAPSSLINPHATAGCSLIAAQRLSRIHPST